MSHSDMRVIRITAPVTGATPIRLDLGDYRHSRLQVITGGDGFYLSNQQQNASSSAGMYFPVGAGDTPPAQPVNLDNLGGVFFISSTGSNPSYISIIQWGCN